MPVTTSTYSIGNPQIDGRVWVTETHTYDTGAVQVMTYLSAPGLDFAGVAAMHAASLNAAEAAVPQSISLVQAHRAVVAAGIKDQVEAIVAQAGPDVAALWYTSEVVERDNPHLNALAKQLWPTDTASYLDNLFRVGSRL